MSKKASSILGINGVGDFVPNERSLVAQEVRISYYTDSSKETVQAYPEATTDPLDPSNWTSFKKHTILGIVMWL
jgi:hypothetical protein